MQFHIFDLLPIRSAIWLVVAIGAAVVVPAQGEERLRIATFNASLYGDQAGQIHDRLLDGEDEQAEQVASIVQTVRPDILLINEIDYDQGGVTAKLLAENFFSVGQGDREPIDYPYIYAAPSNTAIDSGLDLDQDGRIGQPNDAWGYGVYPGQYSMAIYSRFPIDEPGVRTFQNYLWKDLPRALRPMAPGTDESYFEDSTWNRLRLSSKNHVSAPIVISGRKLNLLVSHPTPPVFDGDEDRNGCRNHDEIRFWSDFLAGSQAKHLVDDQGRRGGLAPDDTFVIMGDLNSDSQDGDSRPEAIVGLLKHPRVSDPRPRHGGAPDLGDRALRSGANGRQSAGTEMYTADFRGSGKMRIDYVLPDRSLKLHASGVFWPDEDDDDYALISASDHRLVWVEVSLP